MTNLTPMLIGLSMVAVFAGILGGIFYRLGEKKEAAAKALAAARAAAPTTWKHIGVEPPAGVGLALWVIVQNLPGLPARGVIEWMPEPYIIDGFGKVAGNVQSNDPVHVRVAYFPLVEETALAHELTHVWDAAVAKRSSPRESPADKDFVALFTSINRNIAVTLGR